MRLSRLYIALPLAEGKSITLPPEASHYLGKVLRLKVDDPVRLFNDNNGEFHGLITAVSKTKVAVFLEQLIASTPPIGLRTHLGLGLSRGERMDFAIQKATELGVTEISPLFTARSEVKLNPERAAKRLTHWQKIAVSASEQCGRLTIPEIHSPILLVDWLTEISSIDSSKTPGLARFVFDGSGKPLQADSSPLNSIALVIGPEGGLTADEVGLCEQTKFNKVRLGPRVLRTETAPLAALTVLQFLHGDLQPKHSA